MRKQILFSCTISSIICSLRAGTNIQTESSTLHKLCHLFKWHFKASQRKEREREKRTGHYIFAITIFKMRPHTKWRSDMRNRCAAMSLAFVHSFFLCVSLSVENKRSNTFSQMTCPWFDKRHKPLSLLCCSVAAEIRRNAACNLVAVQIYQCIALFFSVKLNF